MSAVTCIMRGRLNSFTGPDSIGAEIGLHYDVARFATVTVTVAARGFGPIEWPMSLWLLREGQTGEAVETARTWKASASPAVARQPWVGVTYRRVGMAEPITVWLPTGGLKLFLGKCVREQEAAAARRMDWDAALKALTAETGDAA